MQDVCDRITILFRGAMQTIGQVRDLLQVKDVTQIQTRGMNDQQIVEIKTFLSRIGVNDTVVTHPTTTLEDLFIRIVRENTASGQTVGWIGLKTVVCHPHNLNFLSDLTWLGDNWGWIATGAIAVFGLLIVGFADARRFSLSRAWAISGVCFDESIRKRVLWITPLAIVGVIGITQFQRAIDEQDAVRQSVKICLFATGLVVMLTSIILACTNLPKEIESRVIYTILTKPTTRLELVLGKVIGFARVSLAMVAIMGIFTWVYMRIGTDRAAVCWVTVTSMPPCGLAAPATRPTV